MTSEPQIVWPIYVCDREGWMRRLANPADVAARIEEADLEEPEYAIWDSAGGRCAATLAERGVVVRRVDEDDASEELKLAIDQFFLVLNPDAPAKPKGHAVLSTEALWEAVVGKRDEANFAQQWGRQLATWRLMLRKVSRGR
jgi:hypothetical protein